MTFDEYQQASRTTALYPDHGKNFIYPTLGLVGEAGEIAEKIKKVMRDKQGRFDDATRVELRKELGDVLWYLSQLSVELGLNLEEVAPGSSPTPRRRRQPLVATYNFQLTTYNLNLTT